MHSTSKTIAAFVLSLAFAASIPLHAQQLAGGIIGTVVDSSGAAVPSAAVVVKNTDTNLQLKLVTSSSGSYQAPNLPIGNYSVSFSKDGFKTENHTSILVFGDRTSTVNGKLEIGAISASVEVTATPLLNQVNTTTGYVLDTQAINNTPLGTGSFTQLALLSPGLSADFLNGSGSNAGLGNQAIFSNGQRSSSNSISINGVSADNLFNGQTTSGVASTRFTLSTGETFQSDNSVQTSGSVYDAAGQGLPSPAPEMMQEIRVNSGGYDVSQGGKSGAQIETITKSGTNQFHGMAYDHTQNTIFNAAPFFRNLSTAYTANNKRPALHYDRYGGNIGGPIFKDKLFFFVGYQGVHDSDATAGQSTFTVPLTLTNDRSAQGLSAMALSSFGINIAPSTINAAAIKIFNAQVNGQYMIPTPFTSNPATLMAGGPGYDAFVTGASTFQERQGVGDFDYLPSSAERLSAKLFYQDNPTTSPFGGTTAGFPKTTKAGAPAVSLDSITVLSPTMTWDNRAGLVREYSYADTTQPFTPGSLGVDVYGSANFPSIEVQHSDPTNNKALTFGPANSPFANAGFYQNNFEGSSVFSWVKGKHTLQFGGTWNHSQFNVLNNANNTAFFEFTDWTTLLAGNTQNNGKYFAGSSNRYYRAETAGGFVLDTFRAASNVSITIGLRYDYDGPLEEKYGNLTNFHPSVFQYNLASDTITNDGIVVAGNNKTLGTPGVSSSTLTQTQGNFAPRVGVAWTPSKLKNVVVRAGVGIYSDRGEYFYEFSPPAGSGFNGPFGVTLAQPFVQQVGNTTNGTISEPFAGSVLPAPVTNLSTLNALLPNGAAVAADKTPYLLAGYDSVNKLPYTENWTVDLQWQPTNSMQLSLGYVGNHGVHQVLPIAFNEPGIATPTNPINGQTSSYGFNLAPSVEPLKTFEGGNTSLRAPYLGVDPNSPLFEAEGISNYNALQFGLRKGLSHGLQVTAAYTYSHTLDEQSGLGLFFEGNNPAYPRNSYATSTYDRPHVAMVQFYYQTPKVETGNAFLKQVSNGWAISGITSLQSGTPYDIYDYSGSVAGLYYSSDNELSNPILPLAPGISVNQAKLQGTTGINPGKPLLNSADFYVPTIAAGTMGVPGCVAGVCDNSETVYGGTSRNTFRSPFQKRLDISIMKNIRITERFSVRLQGDAFNVTNTPSFDAPNNDLSLYSVSKGIPTPKSPASQTTFGVIQNTIGSPRFMQLSLTAIF